MEGLESELRVSDTTAAGLAGSLEEGLATEARTEAVAIETASTRTSNEAIGAGSQTGPSVQSETSAQLIATRLEDTTEVHATEKAAHAAEKVARAAEKAAHAEENAAESKLHLFLMLVLIVLFGILLWLLLTSLL